MTRYLCPLILTCLVLAVGLGRADDEADNPKKDKADPPRLKRKNRDGPPGAKAPGKDEKDKADKDKEDKDSKKDDKPKEKEKEEIVPEDGGPMGGDPEEDDKEILERISRNMRLVEEKLGNREVGDPTVQTQRDILKDIDALIRRSQQQEQNQGGGGADQQPQGGEDQQPQGGEDKQGAKQRQQRGGQKMAGKQGQGKQGQRQARAQRQPRPGRMVAGNPQQGQPKMQPGPGDQPGKGGDGPKNDKELDTKLYKDVWGHLPESLRAEMNAYSNPRPFMPRYDDLIKKYYRTIAEQGRKKGD